MLELRDEYYDDKYESEYLFGFIIGKIEVRRKAYKHYRERMKKIGKGTETELDRKLCKYFEEEFMKDERDRELLRYFKQYPNYSSMQIAKKVWKESELWFG